MFNMNEIIVYTKSACVQCRQTKKMLDNSNTPYKEVNVEEDRKAFKSIKDKGFLSAPVVVVKKNGQEVAEWSGFRPERLKGFLKNN